MISSCGIKRGAASRERGVGNKSYSLLLAPRSILLQRSEIELGRPRRHRPRLADGLQLVRHVEVNFVLQDFLNDNLELVLRPGIDQRPRAGIERYQPLLDERR